MIVAIIYGIWVIVCLHLITKTIRENPELHLVYKRPKWLQRQFDKDKIYTMTLPDHGHMDEKTLKTGEKILVFWQDDVDLTIENGIITNIGLK